MPMTGPMIRPTTRPMTRRLETIVPALRPDRAAPLHVLPSKTIPEALGPVGNPS